MARDVELTKAHVAARDLCPTILGALYALRTDQGWMPVFMRRMAFEEAEKSAVELLHVIRLAKSAFETPDV